MSNLNYDDDYEYDYDDCDDEDDDCDDDDDDDDDCDDDDEEILATPRRRTRRVAPRIKETMQTTPQRKVSGRGTVQLIADAIQIHEGWIFPGRGYPRGSRSFRNNNPGNLKYAGQPAAVGQDSGGFAVFPNYELGRNALLRDLNAKFKRNPSLSIPELVHIYAPAADNNDERAYVAAIEAHIRKNA